jgi:protein-disulfide isomerase
MDADQLRSRGFTSAQPGSRGLEMLGQPAPTGPTRGQISLDSLGVDFGTDEAPLRMIEFFDYGCGYCRRFHQETRAPLHEQYVESGQVLWKSIPFVIGNWPASVPVSLAAECARDQGRGYYEAISTLLFRHQSDWKSASAPEELAEGYAEQAGLDMERYRTCFENEEFLWRVQAQTRVAQEAGVRGTPTFFLIGFGPITGALPLETFRQVIDTVLVRVAAAQP